MERTSCPEAVMAVLDTLARTQKPYTISRLSKETGLNRRTVKKALDLLAETQKLLQDKTLDITKLGQTTMIQLTERGGLLNLPKELQNLIIRTAYYPAPSREEEILVFLYREKAFSPESALMLGQSALVKKLVEQGQLGETTKDGELAHYLSDEGKIVSRGALKLYPELESVNL